MEDADPRGDFNAGEQAWPGSTGSWNDRRGPMATAGRRHWATRRQRMNAHPCEWRRLIVGLMAVVLGLGLLGPDIAFAHRDGDGVWVGTFATSPQFVRSTQTAVVFPAQSTLRQVVRTSIGGTEVRVRLSN